MWVLVFAEGVCLRALVQTQARASGDYHPGADQWDVTVSSIFAYSVAIAPTKDNYWYGLSLSSTRVSRRRVYV